MIFYSLSHTATYYLSKGRWFIDQDLLASWGLPYSEILEGLIVCEGNNEVYIKTKTVLVEYEKYGVCLSILFCWQWNVQSYVNKKLHNFWDLISFQKWMSSLKWFDSRCRKKSQVKSVKK